MTTSHSPVHAIRAQAHKIAVTLKKVHAGEEVPGIKGPLEKIEAAKKSGVFKIAIAMDDKLISLDVPWALIEAMPVPELCDFIFRAMHRPIVPIQDADA